MADVPGSESYRRVFASRPAEAWIGNLESALLYTVQPIATAADRTNGQPKFLRSDAWTDLGALRSLGAWADFRHDLTLLPMKTIRVSGGISNMRGELGSPGYVEPVPEAWARVAALAGYIRGGLSRDHVRGIIGPKLDARLRDIENTAARLMQIATSELANRELTSDQAELIVSMPARIAAYESFTDAKLAGGGAPIVAGASGVGRVPATGHPMTVFAIVPRTDGSGGLMLTRGGVYTYFETENPVAFVRSINSGSGEVAQVLSVSSFVDRQRSFSQNASKFEAIEGAIPAVAAAYVPTREERKRMAPTAELHMESNTVRRSEGELWFTVKAPLLEGSDVIISVMNSGGREVYRMPPVRLEGGERYDLIRAESLQPGLYFVRVTDHSGRTLASGRFAVVQ
jgi:hypothetical protein